MANTRRNSRNGLALCALIGAAVTLAACSHEAGKPPHQIALGAAQAANFQAQLASARFLTADEEAEVLELGAAFARDAPDLVYFDFDQSSLIPEARASLDAQADWLKRHPRAAIRIYGHTDKVGSDQYNDALGLRRAEMVASYLEVQGISRNRMQTVTSRGEREPVVHTEDREVLNRRTLTAVVGISINDGPMRTAALFDGKRAQLIYERYVTDTVTPPQKVGTQSTLGSAE